jgi:Chaperone of endosialidase
LGFAAGINVTTADNVVCVGALAFGENFSNRAYIPNIGVFPQAPAAGIEFVTVRLSDGKLGHDASSRRYKEDIKPMGNASELIYKLKPVTYRFKEVDVDPNKRPEPQNLDYGLVAEDVAEIDPKLAVRNGKGEVESFRYKAIYNMMLNEFLKEHRKNEEQEATIAKQQKQIEALAAGLQKVSAQLQANKPAPRIVNNNR